MSRRQWGHGYYTGADEGYSEGVESGIRMGESLGRDLGAMRLAGKVNALTRALSSALTREHNEEEVWSLVHLLFDATRPHLVDKQKACPPHLDVLEKRDNG